MAKRNRFKVVVMVLAVVPAFIGCGIDDEGAWNPKPQSPVVTPGENSPQLPVDPSEILTNIDEIEARQSAIIHCQVPEVYGYPYMLEGNNVPAQGEDTGARFCMGNETHQVGTSFCNWVSSFEARFRAVSECQVTALRTLDYHGIDLLDGEEAWNEYKAKLPQAWSKSPLQIAGHVNKFSSWVAAMMGDGLVVNVPAEPFCFHKDNTTSVAFAKQETLDTLRYFWQSREEAMMQTIAQLQRGIVIEPRGGKRSEIIVEIEETPAAQPAERTCSFNLY